MGGHRVRNKEPMSWSDENEHAFIEILYEKVKSNALQCSTFTRDEWGRINEIMITSTKMDYGIDSLKGKWNRLRKSHRMFSELLGHTSVTWDPNTNKVNAAEEVWQHFYTINKSDYKLFKREGCKHYHTLREIFSGTTATGGLGSASTQHPNTSEEERQLKDDFLNRGVHVTAENDDEVDVVSNTRPRNEIGTSGKRRRKEPKVSKSDKLEACMAQWSFTVSLRNEETELRTLYLKEKLAKIKGKGSCQLDNEVTSPDLYSDVTCLDILNNIEGVSNEVYMKAIKAFKDPDFRVSFVKMPEARRGPILELL
ncbi:L10-interacting MYB domain-containing protein-like [Olea europaea var. sylvestris]|uniref:L10-interacting MYB domain-containing protein-like n=1 Tax=Olea europaea var. sylvestris TaxID=158386 RepID=UPI000C1D2F80|nr:L10-interacting MYB domain-containing protein-like [Olea europaea var. sylvestris]XP_022844888.1 L10-interacting MYB domain-containing protein-like [Olea europaea var. sylvestris]